MILTTNAHGTRDPRLPTEDKGHADRAPHRAPVLLRVIWTNQYGVAIEATLATNRTRTRWFYNEGFVPTDEDKRCGGFGTRILSRATSSLRIAQTWADGMAAMAEVPSVEVRKKGHYYG